ncbi:hypothetical protein SLS53_005052 [Cytospora paraplurivora]|uniref:Uncharacterized protein n=1 Tax=Cytospora paraplurivora TaxID=2898453 RepID=A0AAN9UDT0_9PEZI
MQAYFRRHRAHVDAARQQLVQDYHNTKQARLPSPHSDDDDDEEDMADYVRFVEESIYWDSRPWREFWAYEYPTQRAHRLGIPYCNYDEPGMDLTDYEAMEGSEDDTRNLPAGVAMSGGKRKRGSDEPQASREEGESTAAKRRKLTGLPPITNNTGERSRGRRSRTTRRASDAQDTGRQLPAPAQAGPSRVTRARRQLLSGKDAQLFQLGLRGELDVQGKPRDELKQGLSGDTAGGARRRSGRTRAGSSRPSRTVAL